MLARSGIFRFSDGDGAAAQFDYPWGACPGTPDGTVSTLGGSGREGFADGTGAAAQFCPDGVAVDGEGSIIISDVFDKRLRK